jgi:large subunit ribosomal protein L25
MAFEVVAQTRKTQGTGASRRLRNAGRVPGILYGGKKPALNVEIDHNGLYHQLRDEKFHSSILNLELDGSKEQVLLRAVNMHPFKPQVQHVDFQRVSADEKIHMKVPLHFVNAENSPAVKEQGAIVSHILNKLFIRCLPADLPEFIEVDLGAITIAHSIHVRELNFPKGVEPVLRGKDNPPVVTAQIPKAAIAEEEEAAAAAAAAEAPVEAVPAASEVPASKQKPEAPEAAGGDKAGKDKEEKSGAGKK